MAEEKYKVVCYMRVDADEPEALTLAEAVKEMEHCELMQPENIYVVRKFDETE